MKHKHIERYIRLRQALTQKEWEALNSLYDYQLHEKERQLTENISLDDSEVKVFRSHAQKLLEIDEQVEKGITYKFVNTEKSILADALDVSLDESNEGRKYGRKDITIAIAY